MSFKTSCFIQKCNKEIIDKLLKLGYKVQGQYETMKYGVFCNNGKFKICSTNEQPSVKDKDFIQCYNNEDLFFALAAMAIVAVSYQKDATSNNASIENLTFEEAASPYAVSEKW